MKVGKELLLVLFWFMKNSLAINLGRLSLLWLDFFGVPLVTFGLWKNFIVPLVPQWGDFGLIFDLFVDLWVFVELWVH